MLLLGDGQARSKLVFANLGKYLINRPTYTLGILEGIGVCIEVPAKRGQTQNLDITRNNSHPLTSARLKPSACAGERFWHRAFFSH